MLKKLLLASLATVSADIYLHSPRGGNNRLDDENRDRNNGNRLFDSQNNNRGGANVGNMVYYAGSKLRVEWSAQHGCGNPNSHCELIVQYMCDDNLRDGTTTNTIPENPAECYNNDCDTDVRFGRHESFEYYKHCVNRQRNKGLFTSSQNLKGDSAKYTRQNPNGGRRGYECPEERDYYPYWHPSPWIDLAILTNDVSKCEAYQENSQNTKTLGYCSIQQGSAYDVERYNKMHGNKGKIQIPITKAGEGEGKRCSDINLGKLAGDDHESYDAPVQARWVESGTSKQEQFPDANIGKPECLKTDWSRDNHHGNVDGGYFSSYNLTIPDLISEQCVLRIRYNITTQDFPHFDDDGVSTAALTAAQNKQKGGNEQTPAEYAMGVQYGFNKTDADYKDNGYLLRNNPKVKLFAEIETETGDGEIELQLAVNTAQFGRTFQDRTHRFAIRTNPYNATIHNLEVKGKRGNIVQTYPGTEYEFSPQRLHLKKDSDMVHFQWTGSNTNPNNNAGQGRQGSDRSNIVLLRPKNYEEPSATDAAGESGETFGHYGNSYPTLDINTNTFLGFSVEDVQKLAGIMDSSFEQMSGEMSELDDAGTKFNLPPRKCSVKGVYHFLSTRNNNFSNRSQKGTIICSEASVSAFKISPVGTTVAESSFSIAFAGVDTGAEAVITQVDAVDIASLADMVGVSPVLSSSVAASKLKLNYEEGSLKSYGVFTRAGKVGAWSELDDVDCDDGSCMIDNASANSEYVVIESTDGGAIAGIVIGSLVLVAVIAFIVVFVMRKMKN